MIPFTHGVDRRRQLGVVCLFDAASVDPDVQQAVTHDLICAELKIHVTTDFSLYPATLDLLVCDLVYSPSVR